MQTTRALALAALATAVLTASASGARLDDRWHLTVTGTKISGTYTNTTASVVNGFAVGTALKAKNPIVSFTIAGQKCGLYKPYGSAYCYTNVAVKPGETVTFAGETKEPVGNGIVQMCDTADRGVDNTCLDVKGQKGAAPPPTATTVNIDEERAVSDMIDRLDKAVSLEDDALHAVSTKHFATAAARLGSAWLYVDGGLKGLKDHSDKALDPIESDLGDVLKLDSDAERLLRGTNPNRARRARTLIENALDQKKASKADLERLPH